MTHPESFLGYMLVAPPKIGDRRFANTVIYIINHSPAGAWGIITNKPILNVNVKQVFEKIGMECDIDGVIHAGGPVNNQSIHLLHSPEVKGPETQEVSPGISVSNDLNFLMHISKGFVPKKFKAFLGACSWAPGQLEGELIGVKPWSPEHSWLYAPADPTIIFGLTGIEQWQAAVEKTAKVAIKDWML